MKYLIFLGAGASRAEGIPTQKEIFKTYFANRDQNPAIIEDVFDEFVSFFRDYFGINVMDPGAIFPSFEELMGIFEFIISKIQSPWGIDQEKIDYLSRLNRLKNSIISLITNILTARNPPGHHSLLIKNLKSSKLLSQTAFISLNYDLFIDTALGDSGSTIDYGFKFTNVDRPVSSQVRGATQLYKLHGSINWLYCSSCLRIHLDPNIGVTEPIVVGTEKCHCNGWMEPVIIPPTFFKVFSNPYLRQAWVAAERTLTEVDHIVFSGYSFSNVDVQAKALVKEAELSRQKPITISVVNHYPGKPKREKEIERRRFLRFFKFKDEVFYRDLSFQDFAKDPRNILEI